MAAMAAMAAALIGRWPRGGGRTGQGSRKYYDCVDVEAWMTAEEIRKLDVTADYTVFLREIAAQLAELNARLASWEDDLGEGKGLTVVTYEGC